MTQRSITYLKAKFETNDIPTQADYGDWLDSFLSLESSGAQTLSGSVVVPRIDASVVSAATLTAASASFTRLDADVVSANSATINSITASGIDTTHLNADIVSANSVIASGIDTTHLNADVVSAAAVSADFIHAQGHIRNGYLIVNPLGTTQGSAAPASRDVNYVTCTVATERGVVLSEHATGRIQSIVNDNASVTAVTVFPFSGMNFLGTAEDAGMLLAADETLQITHIGASAYAWTRY